MDNIRTVATKAVVQFEHCRAVVETNPQIDIRPDSISCLSEAYGRFRLWAGNLGVFQDGHASLDWRLRDTGNMSRSVLRLINDLNDNAENSMAPRPFVWRC